MEESIILEARQEFELARRPKGRVWQLEALAFVRVVEMLMSKISYEKIAQLCVTDLKIPKEKAPSYKALWKFWGDGKFWMLLLKTQSRTLQSRAAQTIAQGEELPADWAKASEEKIHQRAFELAQDPTADPVLVLQYANASMRLQRLSHERDEAKQSSQSPIEAGFKELRERASGDAVCESLVEKLAQRLESLQQGTVKRERIYDKADRDRRTLEAFGIFVPPAPEERSAEKGVDGQYFREQDALKLVKWMFRNNPLCVEMVDAAASHVKYRTKVRVGDQLPMSNEEKLAALREMFPFLK